MLYTAQDYFINLFISILIILIISYLFIIVGWTKLPNDCYNMYTTSSTGTVENVIDDSKIQTCNDEINKKQNFINLKKSIVSGVLGIALLFNSKYLNSDGKVNLGLSLAGFYFILFAIIEYLPYLPDIFKLILLLILLLFVLKFYLKK